MARLGIRLVSGIKRVLGLARFLRRLGHLGLVRSRLILPPKHTVQVGQDRAPAIGQPRGHDRQLQRRRQHVPLADAGDQGLAHGPRAATFSQLPGLGRHQPATLARQADIQRRAQAETPRHLGNRVNADTFGHVIEKHVAGLFQRLDHADPAMSAMLPAMETPVTDIHVTGADNGMAGVNRAVFQTRQRHHHLEGGARRILP